MRQVIPQMLGKALARALRVASFLAAFAAFGVALVVTPGEAQPLPLDPQTLQQMQQLQRQGGLPAVPAQYDPTQQQPFVLQPSAPQQAAATPPSRLEQIQSSRAGVQLRQFGYDQFGRGSAVTLPQTGAVQDDYILGPGDEIVLSLRGQENNEIRAIVDRNGQVTLPRLNPVSASGRSLASFRQDVEASVSRAYVATSAFVSVARVRQISVLVSGEVNSPGQRVVTGLASALDAILLAGGVRKSGSLRNVRLQRGGREHVIDLYAVLTDRGITANMRLADGDRIRVPALGPTVAVAGLVRQPGIFELPSGQRSISVVNLMALAGGEEVRTSTRLSLLQIDAGGRTRLVNLAGTTGSVGDSEILFVQLGADQTFGQATLAGGTGLAGNYPISDGTRLSQILKVPGALGPTPYTLFGIVSRRDGRTLMRSLISFTPTAVLNGSEDMVLQSDDIVRVFSMGEARLMLATMREYARGLTAQQAALRNPVSVSSNGANGAPGVTSSANSVQKNATNMSDADVTQEVGAQTLNRGRSTRTMQQVLDNQGQQSLDGSVSGANQNQNEGQGQNFNQNQNGNPRPGSASFLDQAQSPSALGSRLEGMGLDFQERTSTPGSYALNREATTLSQIALPLGVDWLVLLNFLVENQVTMTGAVRGPGNYVIGPSVLLQDLIAAAGGTVNWTDTSGVELITTVVDPRRGLAQTHRSRLELGQQLASYVVRPHDEFRFNQVFTDTNMGNVVVQGEVRYAGSYRLTRGERLSDLLARAGGLTNAAYPFGTVFLRKSVAALEREGYVRAAREVEDQLVAGLTRVGTNRVEAETFTSLQSFVSELRNQQALGRVSIVADPSILASRPELDPLLEADDVIYIPQRPSTISVLGQVMQSGAFPYRSGETVGDYIERAGGYTRFADSSETFVVLPDGTARRIERSWLRFDAADALPPGSAIVVPRNLSPFDLRQTLIDVGSILSQFAVSIASVAVLSRQ